MRVLVTGGAGFIGSNLVKQLIRGSHTVVVLDDFSTGTRDNLSGLPVTIHGYNLNTLWRAGHLWDEPFDVVFHLAAQVGNFRSIDDPYSDAETNINGTLNLLRACLANRVPRIVFSSSAAVYGVPRRIPINEDHPLYPVSPYGASKLAAEKECLAFANCYGLSVACLRYFNVYGVGQRYDAYGNVMPIFVSKMLRGEGIEVYGDGSQTRDYVNVWDVVNANLLAADSSKVGVWNVATGVGTSVSDLIALLARECDREVEVTASPTRKGDVPHSVADISAAKKDLGYAPCVPIDEGIAEYVAWARTEGL